MAVSADHKITVFEFDSQLAQELAVTRVDARRQSTATLPSQIEASTDTHGKRHMNLTVLFWSLNIVIACLVLTNIYIASLRERTLSTQVADAARQTELLRLESEAQRERAAIAERKLKEQASSVDSGWRLKRLEKLVLPRSLTPDQLAAIAKDLPEFGPINIAFRQAGGEPESYAMALIAAFESAGIMGQSYVLRGTQYQGVDMMYADDRGKQLGDKLHQLGIVDVAGPAAQAEGYENLPRNQNTLVVGDKTAVFAVDDGPQLETPSGKGAVISKLQH